MRFKQLIESQSLAEYKQKLKNTKIALIILSAIIIVDLLLTWLYQYKEINPVVNKLLLAGTTGLVTKTVAMASFTGLALYFSRKNLKAKKAFTAFLTACVLLTILNATSAFAECTGQWCQYQNSQQSQGYTSTQKSHITSDLDVATITGSFGNYQPIIYQEGTTKYLLDQNGNYLELRNKYGNLVDEYDTGTSFFCQPTITDDWDGNNQQEIHYCSGTNITVLEYNGTWNKRYTFNPAISTTSTNGLRCVDDPAAGKLCYAFSKATMIKYDFTTLNHTKTNISGMWALTGVPAISDIDNDYVLEAAFRADPNKNSQYGFQVVNTLIGTPQCAVDDINAFAYISDPIMYNLNSAGNQEIFITDYLQRMRMYKSDCTQQWSNTNSVGGDPCTSLPFILPYKNTHLACYLINRGSSAQPQKLKCYDYNNNNTLSATIYDYNGCYAGLTVDGNSQAIAYDANSDGQYEVVTGAAVFSYDAKTNFTTIKNLSGEADMKAVTQDLDNNAEAEIVAYNQTYIKIYSSTFTPAELTTIALSGLQLDQNYANPVCLGTSLTFMANNCSNPALCQYVINSSLVPVPKQYLYTNCGTGNPYIFQAGIPSQSSVTVTCQYNTTYNGNIRIYLTDEVTGTSPINNNYFDVPVAVVNGTPGQTCNLRNYVGINPNLIGIGASTPAQKTLSQSDIDFTINTLTGGGSSFVKTVLGIIFTIAMIVFLAKQGIHNPMVYSVGVFALWILLAMLNLISWIYVIIFAFVMVGASAIFFVKGQVGGGGGT
jgi:hypothetical protein